MDNYIKYILEETAASRIDKKTAAKIISMEQNSSKGEDIAIIGLAVKMPEATNQHQFWNNILEGRDSTSEFPEYRKEGMEEYLCNKGVNPSAVQYLKGAYLDEIDCFDYKFFNLSPKEASLMDPNQRLFLQTAWQAIEDAGLGGNKLVGSKTGIYVGFASNEKNRYEDFVYEADPESLPISIVGNMSSIIAARLAYILDLNGPCIMVDTACSSSLVAVHTACNGIKNGDCETAIVGGVNINLFPVEEIKIGIESSDGRTKSFDDDSDGTGIGEGVAAIVLKPLSKALTDRDNIYAVIKGSAINQDGKSVSITAPNVTAQTEVILNACKNANIDISTLSYIEAHGTGTKLGDPIEIEGIQDAFRTSTDRKQFCAIGSIKSNIGHLYEASGITGMIKAVLALNYKEFPPHINFNKVNRRIQFEESPVYFNDRRCKWEVEEGMPRRCGVSSFGFSGTNCHVILEESPLHRSQEENGQCYVIALSAKSSYSLKQLIRSYEEVLLDKLSSLQSLCYTANTTRGHYQFRLAILFRNKSELRQKLSMASQNDLESLEMNGIYYGNNEKKLVVSTNSTMGKTMGVEGGSAEANSYIQTFIANGKQDKKLLSGICRLYVSGVNVIWSELYKEENYKISLPAYEFEKSKCWFRVMEEQLIKANHKEVVAENIHPLIEKCIVETIDTDIYTTMFNVEDYWVLKEHQIMENYVIPGTTYLEIAQKLSRKYFGDSDIEFKEVMFINPVILGKDEKREVHINLKKEEEKLEFTIGSKPMSDMNSTTGEWDIHSKGSIVKIEGRQPRILNINDLMKQCNNEVRKIEQNKLTEGYVKFGPRWINYHKLWIGGSNVLAEIELPENYKDDLNEFYLHPSLLDMGVNALSITLGKTYLPLIYKSYKVFGSTPKKFYSYITKKTPTNDSETITYDIDLLGVDGTVFGEIRDYSIKKVYDFNKLTKKKIYSQIRWTKSNFGANNYEVKNGAIVIFKDQNELGTALAKRFTELGKEVILIDYGLNFAKINSNQYVVGHIKDDYERLFDDLQDRELSQIIHLFTITTEVGLDDKEGIDDKLNRGIYSAFYIIKQIVSKKVKGRVKLTVISNYACEVTGKEEKVNPCNNSLLSFCKVARKEYANIQVKIIDVDTNTSEERIFNEIVSNTEDDLAYRENERYIPKVESLDIQGITERKLEFTRNGVYVITGGTGGLGLEICKYIASKQRVKLILLSRSEIPSREQWDDLLLAGNNEKLCKIIKNVRKIEELGTKVVFYSVDISNYSKTKEVFEHINQKYHTINGLIHCAGIPGNGFIIKKEKEEIERVLRPKIYGTMVLGKVTANLTMEFLLVFSSIGTMLSFPGQSDYAAANSFLDSFVMLRNKGGKRTIGINWPAWRETGMASDHSVDIDEIVKSITNKDAIEAFDEIINRNINNVIVGEINYTLLEKQGTQLLLPKKDLKSKKDIPVVILGRENGEYSLTEQKLAQSWANVLGLDEINIYQNFNDLGGDSILATHLLQTLNIEFPGKVDITDVFSYSTIHEMAKYIDGKEITTTIVSGKDTSNASIVRGNEMEGVLEKLASGSITIDEADNIIKLGGNE